MGWIKNLRDAFTQVTSKIGREDPAVVTFAGPEEPISGDKTGDYWFGIEVDGIWLPAVTSTPTVIEQLENMKIGQSFRIIDESAEGAMGTRVNAIEATPTQATSPRKFPQPK